LLPGCHSSVSSYLLDDLPNPRCQQRILPAVEFLGIFGTEDGNERGDERFPDFLRNDVFSP